MTENVFCGLCKQPALPDDKLVRLADEQVVEQAPDGSWVCDELREIRYHAGCFMDLVNDNEEPETAKSRTKIMEGDYSREINRKTVTEVIINDESGD